MLLDANCSNLLKQIISFLKGIFLLEQWVFPIEMHQPFDYNGKLSQSFRVGKTQMSHHTYTRRDGFHLSKKKLLKKKKWQDITNLFFLLHFFNGDWTTVNIYMRLIGNL